MAAVDVGARGNPPVPTDDLDDIFDYDVPKDIFQDVNTNMDLPPIAARAPLGDASAAGIGLGIDEEVKVVKRRTPIAKLDESRLLSPAGIPKLRSIAKERLKFKGKGHEYSDVAKLLNTYQLWLDDLYPRAKFADGLAIIEKLGHSKRMQVMRKEWISEGKYKMKVASDSTMPEVSQEIGDSTTETRPVASAASDPVDRSTTLADETNRTFSRISNPERRNGSLQQKAAGDSLFVSDDEQGRDDLPEDDLDALLVEDQMRPKASFEEEDDLDALLAEDEMNAKQNRSNRQALIANEVRRDEEKMFDDEMEAMAAAGDW